MVVLVTGARSGFGQLAALELARRGHTVYAGLRDPDTAGPLLEAAGSLDVRPLALDVTVAEEREAAVGRILDEQGRIDALVNNAGIALGGFLEQVDEAGFRRLMDVNLFAVHALTKQVLPAMRARRAGVVVMVSSMSGRTAMPGLGAYAASKFALEGMSEAWRHELRPFGVRVVLVEPGPYKTDIFGRNRQEVEMEPDGPYAPFAARMRAQVDKAVANAGDPQEVAVAIAEAVEGRKTGLRYPMGPNSRVRRVAGMLPFALTELAVGRVLGEPE
jgi:NAD(P)-dependent dehydrogenase (short-subunit alcohol dehydrogenase family)